MPLPVCKVYTIIKRYINDRYIFNTVIINAEPEKVWTTLTNLALMTQWLGGSEMQIEVQTDWKINSTIFIRGFHHVKFENKGTIIQNEKERNLSYTHFSSTSRLPDIAANYSILEFILTPTDTCTQLTLNISNFPTEIIRKHLEFYWRTTILTIKRTAENINRLQ